MAKAVSTNIIGEVIATSTREIVGQVRSGLESTPAYGSFIVTGKEKPCVGVVYNVETTSIDPHRRPVALERSEEEIPQMFPHLKALLRSQFHVLLIGWMEKNTFRYGFPHTPPAMHAEIREADDLVTAVGQDPAFLRLIFDSGKAPVDELILQVCYRLFEAYGYRNDEMVRVGKILSDMYRDDYDTLRRMMNRIEAWIKQ